MSARSGREGGPTAGALACAGERACGRLLARMAGIAGLALYLGLASPAAAQAPTITIADTISVEAPSQSALPISVGPLDRIPRNSFVRVRGLPPMAALSEGHSIAPGSWAVSLASLPNLKLTMPVAAPGQVEISLALVSVDGAVLAETRSKLVVGPQRASPGAPTSATVLRATVPDPAAAPAMTPEERERALRLLKRGQDELADSNLAGARLFFERAADAGLAEAALALGATYETAELQRLNIRGVQGDVKEARRWYERAAQLGAAEASQRLQRLGKN